VWIGTDNIDEEDWLARKLQRNPPITVRGTFGPWELVDRFAQRGLIKGYILYRADRSAHDRDREPRKIDCSVNVATSLAGILDGIIVDEALEPEAQRHGLKR